MTRLTQSRLKLSCQSPAKHLCLVVFGLMSGTGARLLTTLRKSGVKNVRPYPVLATHADTIECLAFSPTAQPLVKTRHLVA